VFVTSELETFFHQMDKQSLPGLAPEVTVGLGVVCVWLAGSVLSLAHQVFLVVRHEGNT
jgi:hypothetical protein